MAEEKTITKRKPGRPSTGKREERAKKKKKASADRTKRKNKVCHVITSEEAKTRNRTVILEYLADPRNEWLGRVQIARKLLGYTSANSMYAIHSPREIQEIELEAIDMRRTAYISKLSRVDDALFEKAYTGDVQAIKLVYQRFENWSEKHDMKIQGGVVVNVVKFGDFDE